METNFNNPLNKIRSEYKQSHISPKNIEEESVRDVALRGIVEWQAIQEKELPDNLKTYKIKIVSENYYNQLLENLTNENNEDTISEIKNIIKDLNLNERIENWSSLQDLKSIVNIIKNANSKLVKQLQEKNTGKSDSEILSEQKSSDSSRLISLLSLEKEISTSIKTLEANLHKEEIKLNTEAEKILKQYHAEKDLSTKKTPIQKNSLINKISKIFINIFQSIKQKIIPNKKEKIIGKVDIQTNLTNLILNQSNKKKSNITLETIKSQIDEIEHSHLKNKEQASSELAKITGHLKNTISKLKQDKKANKDLILNLEKLSHKTLSLAAQIRAGLSPEVNWTPLQYEFFALAHQNTADTFSKLPWNDYLELEKKNEDVLSIIMENIDMQNRIASSVQIGILTQTNSEKRSKIFMELLDVAHSLVECCDLNSAGSIHSGLVSTNLYRLMEDDIILDDENSNKLDDLNNSLGVKKQKERNKQLSNDESQKKIATPFLGIYSQNRFQYRENLKKLNEEDDSEIKAQKQQQLHEKYGSSIEELSIFSNSKDQHKKWAEEINATSPISSLTSRQKIEEKIFSKGKIKKFSNDLEQLKLKLSQSSKDEKANLEQQVSEFWDNKARDSMYEISLKIKPKREITPSRRTLLGNLGRKRRM